MENTLYDKMNNQFEGGVSDDSDLFDAPPTNEDEDDEENLIDLLRVKHMLETHKISDARKLECYIISQVTPFEWKELYNMGTKKSNVYINAFNEQTLQRGMTMETPTGWDVKLLYPIDVVGVEVNSVSVREPFRHELGNSRDVMSVRQQIPLVSNLCNIPRKDLLEMAFCDFLTILELFRQDDLL